MIVCVCSYRLEVEPDVPEDGKSAKLGPEKLLPAVMFNVWRCTYGFSRVRHTLKYMGCYLYV